MRKNGSGGSNFNKYTHIQLKYQLFINTNIFIKCTVSSRHFMYCLFGMSYPKDVIPTVTNNALTFFQNQQQLDAISTGLLTRLYCIYLCINGVEKLKLGQTKKELSTAAVNQITDIKVILKISSCCSGCICMTRVGLILNFK